MTSQTKKSLLKLTILVSGGVMMADLAVYPAAEKIFADFSGTSLGILNFILTGPSLILIFSSILCGLLTHYFSKKTLVAGAYFLFTLSALACALVQSPLLLALLRGCMGVGMGFVGTAMVGIIAELYENENERSAVLGYYNGVMSGLGALFSFLAGYLAMYNWHFVFLVFLIMIPVFFAILLFIPSTSPEGVQKTEAATENGSFRKVFSLAGAALVINSMYAVVLTQIAVIVDELGVGDASTAGIMGSLGTLGSLLACVSFGFLYEKLRHRIPVVYSLILAAGFLALSFAGNVWTVGLVCTVLGAMYGLSFSYYLMQASVIVPASKASLSISIVNAAVYLGIFLGPYIPVAYMTAMHRDSITAILPFIAGTLLICGIVSALVSVKHRHL